MTAYALAPTPRVTGGLGSRRSLGGIVARVAGPGARVLLVADPGLAATGATDDIRAILAKDVASIETFSAFASDPGTAETDAGAALARRMGAHVVVALGGGSALDLGKAVAAIAGADRPALDYELCKTDFPARRLPAICLPTTSGTGSEATRTAVLTRPDHAKTWLWGDAVKPAEVVLDPELTVSLPAALTAATGIDALVHAVEAATNRNANAANDVYAFEAIRLVARHLERAMAEPADLTAREGLQRAAFLAGIAIDNGGTAIAHAIGHAMGSLAKIHHGRAVGLAMLASLPWNVEVNAERFAACAVAMGAKASAVDFIDAYERLLRGCGIAVPVTVEFAGVTPRALAVQAARPENEAMRASNARDATNADLLRLAARVLEQV